MSETGCSQSFTPLPQRKFRSRGRSRRLRLRAAEVGFSTSDDSTDDAKTESQQPPQDETTTEVDEKSEAKNGNVVSGVDDEGVGVVGNVTESVGGNTGNTGNLVAEAEDAPLVPTPEIMDSESVSENLGVRQNLVSGDGDRGVIGTVTDRVEGDTSSRSGILMSKAEKASVGSNREMTRQDGEDGATNLAEGGEEKEGKRRQKKGKRQDRKENVKKPPHLRNRPGMNSYLKVILDDASLDRMHNMATAIRDYVQLTFQEEEEEKKVQKEDNVQETGGDTNRKRKNHRKGLTFKPRGRQSLHMTFFFGGETLCALPPEELTDWYGKISARLATSSFMVNTGTSASVSLGVEPVQEIVPNFDNDGSEKKKSTAGFVQTSTAAAGSTDTKHNFDERSSDAPETGSDAPPPPAASAYTMQFRELTLFPPHRKNLIVAIFEASPAMHSLHDDVRDIAKDGESDMLASVVQRSKERWTPHVTIGNLNGGKKADMNKLDQMINSGIGWRWDDMKKDVGNDGGGGGVSRKDTSIEKNGGRSSALVAFDAQVKSIAMGGPVPEQVVLDWDFQLSSSHR